MTDAPDIDWVEWDRWKQHHGRGEDSLGEFWEKHLKNKLTLQEWRRREEKDEAAMKNDLLQSIPDDDRTRTSSPFEPAQGGVFKQKFRLGSQIGSGGGGIVWKAFDTSFDPPKGVAIKFLPTSAAAPVGSLDREAALTRELADAGASVVQVFEFGNHPPHIVMQLCKGDVCCLLAAPKARTEAVLRARLVEKVARTLAVAHNRNYTHRDVKPGNILLNEAHEPLVSDWGLATADVQFALGSAPPGCSRPYASPEQIDRTRGSVGPGSDVYGLGVVLFEMLTGQRPPHADERARDEASSTNPPQFLSRLDSSLLPEIRSVCEKALALRPEGRYRDAAEMAADLSKTIESVEHPEQHPWPVDFSRLVEAKRRDFFGREWLFDEIDSQAGSAQVLLIKGEPGSGKSAIIAELVPQTLVDRHSPLDPATEHGKAVQRIAGRVIAYHFCEYGRDDDALNAPRFVASIAAMLVQTMPEHAEQFRGQQVQNALKRDPVTAFKEAVLDPLCNIDIPEGESRYLLVDALDEAELRRDSTGPSIVEVLGRNINHLPGWLRIVATVRRGDRSVHRFSHASRSIVLQAQETEDSDERREAKRCDLRGFIMARLNSPNLAKLVTAEAAQTYQSADSIQEQVVDGLLGKAEGNFLYVVEALRQMEETPSLDVASLPRGLFGLYDGWLRRHYPTTKSWDAARQVLELVVAAFEPPSEALLRTALGVDECDLRTTLKPLRTYLDIRSGGINFYHKSFHDWLLDGRNADFCVSCDVGNRRWAEAGVADASDDAAGMDVYYVKYLPAHIVAHLNSARADERPALRKQLVCLLDNGHFVQRKRLAGLDHRLLRDIDEALNTLPFPDTNWDDSRRSLTDRAQRILAQTQSVRATAPVMLVRRFRHSHLLGLAIDPEGRYCVSGGDAGVQCWNVSAARLEREQKYGLSNYRSMDQQDVFMPRAMSDNGAIACIWSQRTRFLICDLRRMHYLDSATAYIWDLSNGQLDEPPVNELPELTQEEWDKYLAYVDAGPPEPYLPPGELPEDSEEERYYRLLEECADCAMSGDGDLLLSISSFGIVRLWSRAQSRFLARLSDATDHRAGRIGSRQYRIRMSRDARSAASLGMDGVLRVWDVAGRARRHVIELDIRGTPIMKVLALSPDGALALVAMADGRIQAWSTETARLVHEIRTPSAVTALAASTHGAVVVAGYDDGNISVWHDRLKIASRQFAAHADKVGDVAITENGQLIFSGRMSWDTPDSEIRVWQLAARSTH